MLEKEKFNKCKELIDSLCKNHSLSPDEYELLLDNHCDETREYAKSKAVQLRKKIYGNKIYIRGLIEISNFCKNDCLYCGIRASNKTCERYRLSEEQILSCCKTGYELGFRTFVLQGGEDGVMNDAFICNIVSRIKSTYPDCAVTLSVGEKTRESYEAYFKAGADRYLLRHETADKTHYEKLHTKAQSFENRIRCLKELKDIGYQVGCGFMVGSPYQTNHSLALDLKFIEEFKPDMCGIGPFIPHKATPFAQCEQGTVEMTCYLLSLIRIIKPDVLLPSTTALATISKDGREMGILSGANVIMPNLSPENERQKYELYNNKLCSDEEAGENLKKLKEKMKEIGYEIVTSRGDIIRTEE